MGGQPQFELNLENVLRGQYSPKSLSQKITDVRKNNRMQTYPDSEHGQIVGKVISKKEIIRKATIRTIPFYTSNLENIQKKFGRLDAAENFFASIESVLENTFDILDEQNKKILSTNIDSFIDLATVQFGDIQMLNKAYSLKSKYFTKKDSERKKIEERIAKYSMLRTRIHRGEWEFEDSDLLPPMKIVKNFWAKPEDKEALHQIGRANNMSYRQVVDVFYPVFDFVHLRGSRVVDKEDVLNHFKNEKRYASYGDDLILYTINLTFKNKEYLSLVIDKS